MYFPSWYKFNLCLHINLHQDGLSARDAVVAILAVAGRGNWRYGLVCFTMAAGAETD